MGPTVQSFLGPLYCLERLLEEKCILLLRMKKAFLTTDQRKPWFGAARQAMAQGNSDPLTEGLIEAAEKQ